MQIKVFSTLTEHLQGIGTISFTSRILKAFSTSMTKDIHLTMKIIYNLQFSQSLINYIENQYYNDNIKDNKFKLVVRDSGMNQRKVYGL